MQYVFEKFTILFCPEKSVAGVTETGNDIGVLIEVIVDRREIDIDVGMALLHLGDAFRRADEAHQPDVVYVFRLEHIDGV